MDWVETKSLLQELEVLFSRSNDVADVADVAKMAREIELHREASLRSAKDLIKELTAAVADKEAEILAPPETQHNKVLSALQEDKENVNRQYEALREGIDGKRERVRQLAKERLVLASSLGSEDDAASASAAPSSDLALAESRAAYALSLYAKISNISWNYNDTKKISGYIANEATKQFKTFEFAPSADPVDVAHALWDLIDENTASTTATYA